MDMEREKMERPKPTVRRRKKFQPPGDEAKRVSAIEEHDGEGGGGGEGSGQQAVGSHDQEQQEQVNGDESVQQGSSDDAGALEKSGEGENSEPNQNAENRFGDGSGEGWEMITEVPNISVSADEAQGGAQSQRCSLKKQKSEEATSVHSTNLDVSTNGPISPSSPDPTRSNRTTRKKKPPPFRPPPYNPKTPPIPPKVRKSVSSKLAEEAKRIVRPEGPSPESTPEPEEHRQALQQQEDAPNNHIYEFIEPYHAPTPLRLVENGHVPGRTKYLGSSSSDTSVSPSQTLSRSTSIGNSDSVIHATGDAGQKHSGSVSFSNLRSAIHRGENGKKVRPQSEASTTSLASVRDLETSFEVSKSLIQ